jgi:hypothetical protein
MEHDLAVVPVHFDTDHLACRLDQSSHRLEEEEVVVMLQEPKKTKKKAV